MEQGKTLADALQAVRIRADQSFDVNVDPTEADLDVIEVLTSSGQMKFRIGADYGIVDMGSPRSPVIVLISNDTKKLVMIDGANPNVIGCSYIFKRPIVSPKRQSGTPRMTRGSR